jgi:Flp pilus assembly protein TadG
MKKLFHSPQRGQTLVEFAVIIPVFLLLAVVIFDFGRAVYYYSAIHNAAREGARYGAVNYLVVSGKNTADVGGMKAAATNYAIGLGLSTSNVVAGLGVPEYAGGEDNPTVDVIVTYCFVPVTPLVDIFVPVQTDSVCGCNKHLLLSSEAVMRTEWWLPSP